jgi:TolB-like protein
VPPEVVAALQRALAKAPADRFNPVAQFAQALAPGAAAPGAPPRRAWSSRWTGIVAAGALAVAVGLFFLSREFVRESAPHYERLAVLPLDNATGDSGQAFFADGMTRELIGVLTDAGVRTLGYRAVAAYRGTTLAAERIAGELGVDALVTGTVLQAGDVVQIAVELTDPSSGENLWARTFSRPAPEVVSLQHEVALEVARGIRARLTPDQERTLGDAGRVDPKAYAQYLLGAEQTAWRTPEGFRRGLEYLQRSIALDSTFAPTWATMAIASTYALIYQIAPREAARALLERAARRAMELDPRLGDPYFALGAARVHMDWDFAGADEMFRQGRERTLSTQALALQTWIAWELREWPQAIATALHLIEQEPTTSQWRSDLAWGYWSSRDTARARASALAAIAADSAFYEGYDILSLILMDARDFAGAERAHRRAIAIVGGDYWVRQFNDGMIAAARGDTAAVRRIVREMEGDPRLAQRAGLLYLAGDKDAMYAMFDRAITARDPDLLQILNAMPFLYPLRQEARYQALLARIGLPEALRR